MSAESILRRLIRYSAGKSFLQAGGLVDRLMRDEHDDYVSVTRALKQLAGAGDLVASDWANGVPLGRVVVKAVADVMPSEVAWRAAMSLAGIEDIEADALAACHMVLPDWTERDRVRLASGLQELRAAKPSGYSFEVSARYLMGSSKLLRMLPTRSLRAFGIATELLTEPPADLVIAGSSLPRTVVLVENPHAFKAALAVSQDLPVALMQTFGFGLSMDSEEWGQSLAETVEQDHSTLHDLVASGAPPPSCELLSHSNIVFWGDLDPAGWAIYGRLRARLPGLRLSALYEPMKQALALHSHPLTLAVGKAGQGTAVKLINAPAWWPVDRGLDQEFVTPDLIRALVLDALLG